MGNSPENRAFDVTANRLHTQRLGHMPDPVERQYAIERSVAGWSAQAS
jgi:hypothetical protein